LFVFFTLKVLGDFVANNFWFPDELGFPPKKWRTSPPHSTGGQVCYAPTSLSGLGIND